MSVVDNERYLIMHPDFRMIVLANRPGFPFLGNDFYSSLGKYNSPRYMLILKFVL